MLSATPRLRLLAALLTASVLVPAGAAAAAPPSAPRVFALPMTAIAAPAEPYAVYQGQSICTSGATPGVLAFQKMVMARYQGSRNLGITRGCSSGGRSEHKEGRAWDWGVLLSRPTEKAYAEDVIGWLLAPDAAGVRAANARRLGVMYMIWNRKIWTANRAADGWRSYFGPNPHVDHIHFSWTWPGAQKLTSYWTGKPYGVGAAGGQLDPLWGTAGWLPIQPADSLRLINSLRWSDGRLWNVSQSTVSAEVVIEERLPGGALGSAFGGSGRTRVALPANTTVNAAALSPGGAVLVAGRTLPPAELVAVPTQDLFALRITSTGVADPTFGTGGTVVKDLGGDESANSVASIGADMVIAGSTIAGGNQSMVVAKLSSVGTALAFGTNGVFVAPVGTVFTADSLLPRPDGSIIVGCRTATSSCAAKLTSTGLYDPTWGAAGVTTLADTGGLAVLAPGPGSTVYAATPDDARGLAIIYRLNTIGLGDPTFGAGQYWLQPFGVAGCNARPTTMTVRSDGSPVIAGLLEGCGKGFIARLTTDGPLDPTWGNAGSAGIATFATVAGAAVAGVAMVAYQPDGQLLVVASGGSGTATAPSIGRMTSVGPVPARTIALRSTASVAYGAPVQLTAVVRSTNSFGLISDVPVIFEARTAGSSTWRTVGSVAGTTGGIATLNLTPAAAASYRVRSGATKLLLPATSALVGIRVGFSLSSSVRPAPPVRLVAKAPVVLSIVAKPARPGRRVFLQRYERGAWRTVARPLLDVKSAASVRLTSATPATGRFRWAILADPGLDATMTATFTVVWNAKPVAPGAPKPGAPTPVVPLPVPVPLPLPLPVPVPGPVPIPAPVPVPGPVPTVSMTATPIPAAPAPAAPAAPAETAAPAPAPTAPPAATPAQGAAPSLAAAPANPS